MIKVTEGMVLPTTMTGSYPKPNWYTQGLEWASFQGCNGDPPISGAVPGCRGSGD